MRTWIGAAATLLALSACQPPLTPQQQRCLALAYERFPPRYRQSAPVYQPPQQTQMVCRRDMWGDVTCKTGPSGIGFISNNPAIDAFNASYDVNTNARAVWTDACVAEHAGQPADPPSGRLCNRPAFDVCEPSDVKGYLCKVRPDCP